jgi:predicted metal-dependent peptidase
MDKSTYDKYKDTPILQRPVYIPIHEVTLDAQQTRQWERMRAKLIMAAPGFVHVLYKMLSRAGHKHALFTDDPQIPVAATDGVVMLLQVNEIFKYPISQSTFIMIHEIAHCMFNHPVMFQHCRVKKEVRFADGSKLPYDEATMQQAADYLINDMIVQAKFAGIEAPPDVLHDPSLITYRDSLPDAYRKLYRHKPPGPNAGGMGQQPHPGGSGASTPAPGGKKSFDVVLKPGQAQAKDPTVAEQQRSDQEWRTAVKAAHNLSKVQGKLPASLARAFEDIEEPQVDWTDRVEGFFKRRLGGGRYDFRKPDRRFIVRDIFTPARSGYGAEVVVLGVDTSGSINDQTLSRWFGEMKGILQDVKPARLVVIWCDAHVGRVDDVEDTDDLARLKLKKAPGGGGTSFVPVFECVKEMGLKPDALIFLTDGQGTFPSTAPDYPVLWGSIYKPSVYPFGEVINVPVQVQ